MTKATPKKGGLPPIAYILFCLILFIGLPKFLPWIGQQIAVRLPLSSQSNSLLSQRMSTGERILITAESTSEKQAGVTAYAKGDYKAAIDHFSNSLRQQRNDPEALIYKNNAEFADRPTYKIAVVVPIGSNLNIAQEMLRGVAQAQNEINSRGGIRGIGLQVEIVNDDNSSDIAKEVANQLVSDPTILAVVGHNASNASLAAAPIYQQGGLVMISPTSFATALSGIGSYIFRTSPDMKETAARLAQYAVATGKTKIAVCYDSQSSDNVSFKDEFVAALTSAGGELIPIICDLSQPSFDPAQSIAAAQSKGANGLLLSPFIDRIDRAIAAARAAQGQLALFSSPSLYTIQTLEQGQAAVEGLVFPAIWHPDVDSSHPFAASAQQQWGGTVNWRTATSYDATFTLITALQQTATRTGIQQILRDPSFQMPGASGLIKFSAAGDRVGQSVLIQVERQGSGFGFVPLSRER